MPFYLNSFYHSHLSTLFDKKSINANIMNTQIFDKIKYDLKVHIRPLLCYVEVMWFLTILDPLAKLQPRTLT